ncbi:hypothetical protein GCM10027348_39450 [Hymenobacter tenuis]
MYDLDGAPLGPGAVLEPFGKMFLEPEAQFLWAAPLWRVEIDAAGNWRTLPQRGGKFYEFTQEVAAQCRSWPNPVTDICEPTGRRCPAGTPEEHKFYAV